MSTSNLPVETDSYHATLSTIDRIVSECMYDGIPVDRPSALAAAYSVPDGASVWMAVVNLDIAIRPSDEICERHERLRQKHGATVKAFRRGPRW
jgi:hypothetical protein